jgi:hypothetical protein
MAASQILWPEPSPTTVGEAASRMTAGNCAWSGGVEWNELTTSLSGRRTSPGSNSPWKASEQNIRTRENMGEVDEAPEEWRE